jgi:hypothetical protein
MIPDVTPNGVFYLPPTGWLTSFYNLPINVNHHLSQISTEYTIHELKVDTMVSQADLKLE